MSSCEASNALKSRELKYSAQRKITEGMCENRQWLGVLSLINDHYGFKIKEKYLQAAAGIFEKRLSQTIRWDRNGGPIMPKKDKGNSASHTVQVFLLAGWILSKVPVSQKFKTQIGEMVLVHELGESFGELSTFGNRTSEKETGREKTIRNLKRELRLDKSNEGKRLLKKVNQYTGDGVLDEEERAMLEGDIGEYVAKKDVGGDLAEQMILRQKQTEENSYAAKVHKLIERLETTKQWVDKIIIPKGCEEKYIARSILYLKKPLDLVLRSSKTERNEELNLLLDQLSAAVVAGVRNRTDYDAKISI